MKQYFKYIWYLLKHRTFVSLYCFRRGLIWRGLKHDISKFNPKEFIPYANYFFADDAPVRGKNGYYAPTLATDVKFKKAWTHHFHHNDHHWQHYIIPKDGDLGGFDILSMPENAIKEMICDWWGAGKAQKSSLNIKEWYKVNKDKLILDILSRAIVEVVLEDWFGY